MFTGLYSNSGFVGTSPLFENWPLVSPDPLQHKAEALLNFCFPNASMLAPGSPEAYSFDALKSILTPDNINHLLREYKNFHSHWPLLHIPTFDPLAANDGLVLAMCCTGAVYSDRIGPKSVRWLMDIVRTAVLKGSNVYKLAEDPGHVADLSRHAPSEVEEFQALCLLHGLFLWHGDQKQRQQAREEFWRLANVTRSAKLLQSLPSTSASFSSLHQPGPMTGDEVNSWNWASWVECEKRVRVAVYIFLTDAATTIYSNISPLFDVYEMTTLLPADDAAWEARTGDECADALGLRGEAAQAKNMTGTRRAKQLGLSEALQILNRGAHPERATNAFGKFSKCTVQAGNATTNTPPVLVHAIHVQIFNIQRQLLRRVSTSAGVPHPQGDGPATPPNGINEQVQQLLRSTVTALETWKTCWDVDLAIQYAQAQPRVGFCRDGVHFYFLARQFLRSSRREEWAAPAELRCRHVFHLLKQIRAHVASDSSQKGIDFGSMTTIADDYGISDLTLNMKQLFTPLQ
jgi:hypothetical protein